MAEIYPNYPLLYHPANFNAPFQNVYSNMKNLTLALLLNKDVRVIQRNLVYVIGLPYELINMENKLKAYEYFGQYGKIVKLLVNKNKTYNTNNRNGPSYSCYITYSKEEESSLAILSLDSYIIHNHELKANYGTTKFCHNFLENFECKNKDCLFLHKLVDINDITSLEQMNSDKEIFHQQRQMAIELSHVLTNNKYNELYKLKDIRTVFPNGFSVYTKELVIQYINEKKSMGISLNLKLQELKMNSNHKKIVNEQVQKNNKNEEQSLQLKENINKTNIDDKNFFHNIVTGHKKLNLLYKSAPKSRFEFANSNSNNIQELNQIIPSQINEFLTRQFTKHSILFNSEQINLNDYYFSLKPNSLDSDDSWSSLVATLKKWDNVYDNDDDFKSKFNTY